MVLSFYILQADTRKRNPLLSFVCRTVLSLWYPRQHLSVSSIQPIGHNPKPQRSCASCGTSIIRIAGGRQRSVYGECRLSTLSYSGSRQGVYWNLILVLRWRNSDREFGYRWVILWFMWCRRRNDILGERYKK